MDALLQLDAQLLLWLNYFHTAFFDKAFWLTSDTLVWVPMYLVLLYAIVKGQKWQSWITVLALIVMVVLCDRISTDIFKYGFERLRPTHDEELKDIVKTVFGYRGGKFGFVSSHATNTIGLAVFSSLLFRNTYYTAFMLIWSVLVSYSRIYLGVHFPGDVIGGLLLGALLGYLVYKVYQIVMTRYAQAGHLKKKEIKKHIAATFNQRQIHQIIFTGLLTFVLILIFSKVMPV
ncbi:undecaprenyl-diphosphatase [Saccharicrinis carchari]|uniref:Undecaprenyl-diphosphatase n=1 Tax=Saccharicrinis carchari TaxID=1168039 RepID=A0A521AP16_SACCC|nr:phosphatase PAP2 family protein [Saccharicrinis carchari]SMO36552.1 undecaprenyl-diphosphatase [Saccharicrinis carchari]